MSTPQHRTETDGASPSGHACLICRSPGERWNRLADFVREGLLSGRRDGEELGLTGMLERALSVGGTLEVESEPGRGTTIRTRLPLDAR